MSREIFMIERLVKLLNEVQDHVWAVLVVLAGAGVAIFHGHTATGEAIIVAGTTMWRGKQ
jgi:hypothetical protein